MIDAEALEVLSTNEERGRPHALMLKDEEAMYRTSLLDISCIGAFLGLPLAGLVLYLVTSQNWIYHTEQPLYEESLFDKESCKPGALDIMNSYPPIPSGGQDEN